MEAADGTANASRNVNGVFAAGAGAFPAHKTGDGRAYVKKTVNADQKNRWVCSFCDSEKIGHNHTRVIEICCMYFKTRMLQWPFYNLESHQFVQHLGTTWG